MRERGQALGVLLEQLEELHVPWHVVEAGALAMDLVRQPAGGDDDDAQVLRVALDRAPQRLAELVEPARARAAGTAAPPSAAARCVHRPALAVLAQHRQWREAAMVERLALEEGQVELFHHQRLADMRGQPRMAHDGGQVALATALVSDLIALADAERERRVMVEEERGHMVVVGHDHEIRRLDIGQPLLDRREGLEDRGPDRAVLSLRLRSEGEADGGGVRDAATPPMMLAMPRVLLCDGSGLLAEMLVIRLRAACRATACRHVPCHPCP